MKNAMSIANKCKKESVCEMVRDGMVTKVFRTFSKDGKVEVDIRDF